MEAISFTTVEIILLSVTGLFFIIQLYYFSIYNRIHAHNKAVKKGEIEFTEEYPPVSIIIRAYNESENLRSNLESILQQDYPLFEVIVINDGSTDESEEYLTLLENKYNNLYHSFTPEQVRNVSSKKLALTLGIKASKYDWLLFTEANCRPDTNQWIKRMARNFTSTTDIVLGYSSYTYHKNRYNKLACFDTLFYSMRYLGMALNAKPYMGIGRNMAYRKHLFYDNKGYSKYLELFRGEDDLFINEVANEMNTRVETSAESKIRISSFDYSLLSWKRDKISYIVTARYYSGTQRYILGFETLTRLLFYLSSVAGMITGIINLHWLVAGLSFTIWFIRYLIEIIIINHTSKDMKEERNYYFSPLLFDFLLPLQSLIFRFSHLAHKDNNCVNINNPTHNAWS